MGNYCSNCGENLYGHGDPPAHACPPGDQKAISKYKSSLTVKPIGIVSSEQYTALAKRANELEHLVSEIESLIRASKNRSKEL